MFWSCLVWFLVFCSERSLDARSRRSPPTPWCKTVSCRKAVKLFDSVQFDFLLLRKALRLWCWKVLNQTVARNRQLYLYEISEAFWSSLVWFLVFCTEKPIGFDVGSFCSEKHLDCNVRSFCSERPLDFNVGSFCSEKPLLDFYVGSFCPERHLGFDVGSFCPERPLDFDAGSFCPERPLVFDVEGFCSERPLDFDVGSLYSERLLDVGAGSYCLERPLDFDVGMFLPKLWHKGGSYRKLVKHFDPV